MLCRARLHPQLNFLQLQRAIANDISPLYSDLALDIASAVPIKLKFNAA